MSNAFTTIIAGELQLQQKYVANVLELLDEGCTIPFIARYRKERTGAMDEVQIEAISQRNEKLKEIVKRKETITKTIKEQNLLTEDLQRRIDQCWDATVLEDLYLPYKPKRRTKAQVAREMGLEPLAQTILLQRETRPMQLAERYVKGDVENAEAAIKGAQDIIAEMVSENEEARNKIRNLFQRFAIISSKKKTGKSAAANNDTDAAKYSDYFDFSEPLKRCSGNRILAIRRGEAEGFLRVSISIDDQEAVDRLCRQFVRGRGSCQDLVAEAVEDSYKRLLAPAMENEFSALSKQAADKEAIQVFADNLRQLLLAAPLGQKRVMGIDPGIRTGCKVVCLDAQGSLIYHTVVPYFHPSQAADNRLSLYTQLAERHNIEAIAIGNGTGSRETYDVVKSLFTNASSETLRSISIFVVSEDGASVYSASKVAREEFPDQDVTVRGAVSIGRRLMDPLAELVKIDPKSIGVGQYQHDVDQNELKKSLDRTVESCVNQVGVNLNTASAHLLTYISGLGSVLARNIVDYRNQYGPFASRSQLKKVPRLGPAAFTQCAGFLRIPGARNPLDASAVHPESYHIVEQMAKDQGCSVSELITNAEKRKNIDISRYSGGNDGVGTYTLNDILSELEKPGRDPRAEIETFEFDPNVHTPDDLTEGMILPGIVTNITKFGAFVDIGVHQDGLVHISQLADRYVSDPGDVVHLHQHVKVRVVEVDNVRRRISLSMRNIK